MQPYDQSQIDEAYLLANPGPHWTTKPPLSERERAVATEHTERLKRGKAVWDEELLPLDSDEPLYQQVPRERSSECPRPETYNLRPEANRATIPIQATAGRFSGVWLCRSCRQKPALWPREKAWRWKIWGVTGTIVFRSPLACTDCRVFNFKVIRELGLQDHRPFWNRVFVFPQTLEGWKYRALRWLGGRMM